MPMLSAWLAGNAAEAEQRHGHRRIDALGELAHFLHRAAVQDALPGEDDRLLRRLDQIDRLGHLADFGIVSFGRWPRILTGVASHSQSTFAC